MIELQSYTSGIVSVCPMAIASYRMRNTEIMVELKTGSVYYGEESVYANETESGIEVFAKLVAQGRERMLNEKTSL